MPFMNMPPTLFLYFFFNVTATTEIYTLSLHDALPISTPPVSRAFAAIRFRCRPSTRPHRDRKSTRLNSSHLGISYAVLCLKKKNKTWTKRQHERHRLTQLKQQHRLMQK